MPSLKNTTRVAPYATTATPYHFRIHTLLNVLSVFTLLNILSVFNFLFLPSFVVQKSLQHEALLFWGDVGRQALTYGWTGRLNRAG